MSLAKKQNHAPNKSINPVTSNTAGDICSHFSVTAAAISRHLSVLKEADLIRDHREGKFIYYELNTSVLEEIMFWITELKGDRDDA